MNGKVPLFRSLGARLALFLSLALIPVGVVGVLQTREVLDRISERAGARLTDVTRAAALGEREIVLWSLGAARGLGQMVGAVRQDPGACIRAMAAFADGEPRVASVGFIAADGMMDCASTGQSQDFAGWAEWPDLVASPRVVVNYLAQAPVSGRPVISALVPLMEGEIFEGYVFVSIPHEQLVVLDSGNSSRDVLDGASFMSFNNAGEVLTVSAADSELGDPSRLLPRDRSLRALASSTEVTFTATSNDGDELVYSVIPIVEDTVYAIGIWPGLPARQGPLGLPLELPVFPLLMWALSLAVAYASVDRLVLRHIRRLRAHMAAFARSRRLSPPAAPDMPNVVAELYDTFHDATRTILRDEAELEALVHEKNVLLKEVHHRVKNNLQLISSIMNMQIRKVRSAEAQSILKRLQTRVLSLATIHRNLYKTENLGSVQAGALLEQLVNQLAALGSSGRGLRIETEFEPMTLYPDQAVPVSLLAAEAVTNALKYLGAPESSKPWLRIRMVTEPDGHAVFTVENSKGSETPADEGSGLGSGLMRAFAAQLDTEVVLEDLPDRFRLTCRFKVQGFTPEHVPPEPHPVS